MPVDLSSRLVVGVASSALFDLAESDAFFKKHGEDAYRSYSHERLNEPLGPGVAFPLVRRLLSLNDLAEDADHPLVEVVILSRNDPETGLRVMESIRHHGLAMTRGVFMQGKSPYKFCKAFNVSLFLSAEDQDVRDATAVGLTAGRVIGQPASDSTGNELRIAFDFDGVLGSDSAEQKLLELGGNLDEYSKSELEDADKPIEPGPLLPFLRGINKIQRLEDKRLSLNVDYKRRVHVAVVTARNAPNHLRMIRTLQAHEVRINDAFFMGGVDKYPVLRELRPHIFFDDDPNNFKTATNDVPSVHVPYGVKNVIKEGTAPDVEITQTAETHGAR
jgi:5'-nucleotidase